MAEMRGSIVHNIIFNNQNFYVLILRELVPNSVFSGIIRCTIQEKCRSISMLIEEILSFLLNWEDKTGGNSQIPQSDKSKQSMLK